MDKARIHDLEGLYSAAQCRVDNLDGALDAAYMANDDLQARLAAMREAMEAAIAKPSWEFQHVAKADVMEILDTTDAGKKLLERLAKAEEQVIAYRQRVDDYAVRTWKAEAERVEAYPKYGFCRDINCMMLEEHEHGGTCHRKDKGLPEPYASEAGYCGPAKFHQYLRDHHMIREAE